MHKKRFVILLFAIMLYPMVLSACMPTPSTVTISNSKATPSDENTPNANTLNWEPGSVEPSASVSETPGESVAWVTYREETYKFTGTYPATYTFRPQPAEKLSAFKPIPLAAYIFLSPEKSSSDIADLELPDLDIRVYETNGSTTLENWLTKAELLSANNGVSSKAFKTSNISGLKLCSSTMISPNCSYFIIEKKWVYQFRTGSQVGEEMLNTFKILP